MDTYGHDEMAVPQWKLVQSVGADYAKSLGAKPGDFYCTSTEEIAKELEIVVVDIRKQRTFWGRTDIDEAPPECSSLDGITSLDGKECASCEHRCDTPWSVDSTKRRELCTMNYNILAINTADSMPCLIRAGGINALPTRQLLTLLRFNKNLKGEYHRALIAVTSAKKKTPAGEAYTLHFKIKGLAPEAQANELKEESLQLLGVPLALPEPEEEEEPLGYTPEGKPVYTEEEKRQVLNELKKEETEVKSKELDLNF
jgi:hypothetical protein